MIESITSFEHLEGNDGSVNLLQSFIEKAMDLTAEEDDLIKRKMFIMVNRLSNLSEPHVSKRLTRILCKLFNFAKMSEY